MYKNGYKNKTLLKKAPLEKLAAIDKIGIILANKYQVSSRKGQIIGTTNNPSNNCNYHCIFFSIWVDSFCNQRALEKRNITVVDANKKEKQWLQDLVDYQLLLELNHH